MIDKGNVPCPICEVVMKYDDSGFWTCDGVGHVVTIEDEPPTPEMPELGWSRRMAELSAREALNKLWDLPELDDVVKREWLEAIERHIAELEAEYAALLLRHNNMGIGGYQVL